MKKCSFHIREIITSVANEGIPLDVGGPRDMVVDHLKNIELADEHSLTFYIGRDRVALAHLRQCALFCLPGMAPESDTVTCLLADDPKLAFYIAAQAFTPEPPSPGVHPRQSFIPWRRCIRRPVSDLTASLINAS